VTDLDSSDSEPEPIDDLFLTYRGPLTADDIKLIEAEMDGLITYLFEDDPQHLEEALEADLADKIEAYIGIADFVQDNPDYAFFAEKAPILSARLRALFKMVNEYYHSLN
jgi:hypothetical protein